MNRIIKWLDLPPVWLAGFMAAAWGLAQYWAVWGEALLWPGRAIIAAGIVLAIWSAQAFRRARTTIVPREEPSALVGCGPYRWSRNPIYIADLMILAGWAISLGAPLGLVLIYPLQQVLLRRFILPEERVLTEHLGAAYEAYCGRVRRWV